jgi:LmbE family N-acetylglucosaminyl deacetylase
LPEGGGSFVSDISATLQTKLEAIRCYRTQFPPGKERVFRLVEGQGRMLGASAGFEAGELLIPATTLGLTNVFQTLCGTDQGPL